MLEIKKTNINLKNKGWSLLLSFIIPFIIVTISYAFNGVYLNSVKSILASDSFTQGANFLAGFQRILQGKDGLLYNWSAGLGLSFLPLYHYYLGGIVTPIVALFSADQIPNAFYLITLIKFGLAGLTSFYYLKKSFNLSWLKTEMLSLGYALMSFALVNSEQVMWLDSLYLLPLLALGIDELINNNKKILLFVTWLVMILTNFYMAYIVGLFVLLYFAIKLVELNQQEWKQKVMQFVGVEALSTLAGGILLLPTIATFLRNKQELSRMTGLFTEDTGIWNLAIKSMVGIFDGTKFGTTPYIYIGILPLIFAVSFFFNKKISKRIKITWGVGLAVIGSGFFFQFMNLSWQGWHFPAMFLFRYSFLWSFVLIILAAKELENSNAKLEARVGLGLAIAFLVAYLSNVTKYHFVTTFSLIFTFVVLLIYVLFLSKFQKNKMAKYLVFAVFIIEISVNAGTMIKNIDTEWHYPLTSLYNDPQKELRTIVKDSQATNALTRLESLDPISRDDGIRFGYGSINLFSSIINRPFEQKMNQLGFKTKGSNLNMTYGNNTLLMDSVLGFGTNIAKNGVDKYGFEQQNHRGKYQVFKNKNALAMGIVVNSADANLKFNPVDNLGNQNLLLNMVGHQKMSQTFFGGVTPEITNLAGISLVDNNKNLLMNDNKDETKSVTLTATIPAKTQAYLNLFRLQGNGLNISVYKDNKFVESYNTDLVGQYASLGYFAQRQTITIRADFNNAANAKVMFPSILLVDTPKFQKAVNAAKKNQVKLAINKSNLSGTVVTKTADQSLFLTIPFDPGWHAKVNGKSVKVESLDDAFCKIPLSKGKNKIEIYFIPQGFILGIICSLVGILGFIGWILYLKKSSKNNL